MKRGMTSAKGSITDLLELCFAFFHIFSIELLISSKESNCCISNLHLDISDVESVALLFHVKIMYFTGNLFLFF